MVPDEKENQTSETNTAAKPEGVGQIDLRQSAEGQVGTHPHRVHYHGVDTQSGGPVLGGDLPVLQLRLKRLKQAAAQPQSQNGTDGREGGVRQSQYCAGQRSAAKKQKCSPGGPGFFSKVSGPDPSHTQHGGGDIEYADGPFWQATAGVLQLI